MTREERKKAIEVLDDMKVKIDIPKAAKTQNDRNWALDVAIQALEQEPCDDVISRKSIKQKLQEHHDFFVNAYGGFSNLPQNDKARVDEITNCIAMVVNEPSVTQKSGKWNTYEIYQGGIKETWYECSECKWSSALLIPRKYCPNCGTDMKG